MSDAQVKCVRMEDIMTIDEKLELFYKTAIDEATRESVTMLSEYEASLNEQYQVAKDTLAEKAELSYHLEEDTILREKNKIVSLAVRDVKKQILEEEKSFQDILFSMVVEKLKEYMKTDEYMKKLREQIQEAKMFAEGGEMTVYINASDQDKKECLEQETDVKLTVSNVDFIGGTRAVIRERNLLIDQSFLVKLSEEKENYSMQ